MAIPSVMQGLIETDDGKVFELESSRGSAWLESIGSFRFEPSGDSKPYTVRKESGIYWYGCRKIAGKVRKKYIGKSLEVTVAKLEEIAEALEIPPAPRANKVAEVAQEVTQGVAEVAQDRLTALELQVANLQKAVEALQEALPGKLKSGDSLELPKVDNEVAERLHNGIGNLQTNEGSDESLRQEIDFLKGLVAKKDSLISSDVWQEVEKVKERNRQLSLKMRSGHQKSSEQISDLEEMLQTKQAQNDRLKADYAALLESSTHVTNKLRDEVQELRSQLETEKTRGEELWGELGDTEEALAEVRAENSDLKKTCDELRSELVDREKELAVALTEVLDLKQKLAAARKLPDAADLLNQLKAKRKKSSATLGDVEKILEILEVSPEN